MKKLSWNRIKYAIKGWKMGDYFRQFSIVAGGVIVTFWGSDLITEHTRRKEVCAAMQLVTEELEHNRKELRDIKHLLDIDIHMSSLLIEHKMNISEIPKDTILKYRKLFTNANSYDYSTDALDVLKGSSLMQYITDKRLLQDVLQSYYKLGRIQKDINDYYETKSDLLMSIVMSAKKADALKNNMDFRENATTMLNNDRFVNYVIMVPGFLDWTIFDSLDEMLDKQIQILGERYK